MNLCYLIRIDNKKLYVISGLELKAKRDEFRENHAQKFLNLNHYI